ncbi:hypothetical protein EV182_005283 [Spiromyces aspiralis]|uniref:Uncharacterized protein n=1 Tax=Spiromyces aspiralis TaxID=68401 RepID=A0ACC1HMU2_9FUNG|nr:hypothetical protein EV182_005283 [Spiromyces aspiralis]
MTFYWYHSLKVPKKAIISSFQFSVDQSKRRYPISKIKLSCLHHKTLWSEEYQCFYYWNSLTGESSWYPPSSSTVADDRPAYQVGGQQAAIDSLFDKIDQVKSKLDSELGLPDSKPAAILPSPADKSCDTGKRKWQHDNDPAGSDQFQAHIVPPALYSAPPLYTAAANFNVCRGKRLQDDPAALDNEPSAELSEFERSRRQCNHYFDYDSYIDAVNQSREGSYSLPEQPRRLTKKQVAALREKKLKNKQAKRTKWLLE